MSKLTIAALLVLSSLFTFACEEQKANTCMVSKPTGEMKLVDREVYDALKGEWVTKQVEVPVTEGVVIPCSESLHIVDTSEQEAEADQKAFEAHCERTTNYSCKGVKAPVAVEGEE